jgi:hypothetical protein
MKEKLSGSFKPLGGQSSEDLSSKGSSMLKAAFSKRLLKDQKKKASREGCQ